MRSFDLRGVPRRSAGPARRARVPVLGAALLPLVGVVGVVGVLGGSPAGAATDPDPVPSVSPAAGSYYPVPVVRLVGDGAAGAVPRAGRAIGPRTPVHVPALGRAGLPPSGVSAVVLNVTVTAGSAPAVVSAQPTTGPLSASFPEAMPVGVSRTTTAISAPAGRTRTALVTALLDPTGAVDLASSAPVTLTADLVGVYAADDTAVAVLGSSGGYQPLDAVRLLGRGAGLTSGPSGPSGPSGAAGSAGGSAVAPTPQSAPTVDPSLAAALPAGSTRRLAVDLGAGVDPHVTALVVRVSVVAASAAGTVSVTAPALSASSTTSAPAVVGADPAVTPVAPVTSAVVAAVPTLTLDPGLTASGLAVVPAHPDPDGLLPLVVRNATPAPADVRVDLVGFYDDGQLGPDLRFRTVPPSRVIDTRTARGVAPLVAGGVRTLAPTPDVVGDSTFALVGSLTVLTPSAARLGAGADVTLRDDDTTPGVSAPGSLPVGPADVQTGPVQPEVGVSGALALTTSRGPVQVVLDVVGTLESSPPVTEPDARSWVPAVSAWQVRAIAR